MASISLRAYNLEIESMIDHGQAEEAVAHCMHILQYVPKHIATYRLLGKALLELQRYTDSTDIFSRVLSSLPDDFISHVGMSIIRENESNLDGAIWHMERAYEAQPANAAIQDELRRLYGRRDGLEPPKIRLTRGALARMYAKGQLYQQAIGELHAALAEDDRRPDLQVQLALMYYQSGQQEQSIRICSDLLKKLPYCFEANRILADLLPESKTSGIQSYQQRLVSLDPYYSHIEPKIASSERVPGNAVVVERLNYQPGQLQLGPASQPDWAVSLGAPFQSSQEDALPEWVSSESQGTPPFPESEERPAIGSSPEMDWLAETEDSSTESVSSEEKIPEFLKEAGWSQSDRTADEIAMEELQKELDDQISDEIEPGEVPDWLREMAPEGALDGNLPTESDEAPDEETIPWLQEAEPGPTDSVVTWLNKTKEPTPEQDIEELESALLEATGNTGKLDAELVTDENSKAALPFDEFETVAQDNLSGSGEEILDWMKEEPVDLWVENDSDLGSSPVSDLQEEEGTSPLPDWISGFKEDSPVEASLDDAGATEEESGDELPDWLIEPESDATGITSDLPSWLVEAESQQEDGVEFDIPEEQTTAELETTEQLGEVDDTLIGALPTELPDQETENKFEDSTFLAEEEITGEVEFETETTSDLELETEDITGWLESLDEAEEETTEPAVDAVGELPDWLAAEDEAEPILLEDTQPTKIVLDEVEELPVEAEAEIEMEAEEAETLIQAAAETPISSELDLDDPDAALAWLESLAAQQGAAADQLTTRPEDRPETPEWIRSSAADAQTRDDLPVYEPTETVEGLTKSAPDLEEPVFEVEPAVPLDTPILDEAAEIETAEPEDEELTSWLQSLDQITEETGEPAELSEIPTAESEKDKLVDIVKPVVGLTGMLSALDSSIEEDTEFPEPSEQMQDEIAAEPELSLASETEDITGWLESLDEAEEETTEPAVDAVGELPDWLAAEDEAEPILLEDTQPTKIVLDEVEELPVEAEAEIEMEAEEAETLIQAAAETPISSELDLDDPDAALAWLESLAAQQGAAADQLTTRPEDRPETPEWIRSSAADAQTRDDLPVYEPTETVEGLTKSAPDLEEPVFEVEPAVPLDTPILDEAAEIETAEPEEMSGDLPEWMVETKEEAIDFVSDEVFEESEPEIEDEVAEGLPGWLQEEESADLLEDTQPRTIVSSSTDETPEWMLESDLGSEEPLVESVGDDENIPVWLREETGEMEAEPEEDSAVKSAEEEIPEWIQASQTTSEPLEMVEAVEEEELVTPISSGEYTGKLDLNTASLADLEKLPGIGFILAQSIINHREVNGPFEQVENLQEVPGVGPYLIEELSDRIEVKIEPTRTLIEERVMEPQTEDEEILMQSRQALIDGDYIAAIEMVSQLIQKNIFLEEIIQDLQDALYNQSSDTKIWESLGDAYLRNNQLQEALEAYLRAEELLSS